MRHSIDSPDICVIMEVASEAIDMWTVSEGAMIAFLPDARNRLRPTLLVHWQEDLRTSAEAIGPMGREQVLREVEQLAVEDRELDLADLMMIADLRLVALAGEVRKAQLRAPY